MSRGQWYKCDVCGTIITGDSEDPCLVLTYMESDPLDHPAHMTDICKPCNKAVIDLLNLRMLSGNSPTIT
jgi:hypothetical protein